jgi:hypothetical protein
MVGNVARGYRPRLGQLQPLRQRWECLREQVTRTLPDHHLDRSTLQLPCDEWACDALEDALAKFERDKASAVEPPSAALKAAFSEITTLRERYARAHAELLEQQKVVRRVANDRAHLIMRDIPVNALDEFPPISLSVDNHPMHYISSIATARKAASDLLVPVMFLEALVKQLRDALEFHHQPGDVQNRMMINKLYDGMQLLAARLEQLEEKLAPSKPKKRAA